MNREVIIFTSIAAAIILLIAGVVLYKVPIPFVIAGLVLVVIVSYLLPKLVEIKEYERAVVFRFGKFNRVAGPGWTLVWPQFEKMVTVDLRTTTVDLPKQDVMTRDDIEIKVDAVVYLKIVDPKKVVVEIKDYAGAIRELLKSQIRNTVSKMELEEVLEKTEDINSDLKNVLKEAASEWGISTVKVEIQAITLPPSLVEAMHKRKEATENKMKAETEALAKQLSLDILNKSASQLSDKTVAYLYIDALKAISNGKANKIIFPLELSHLANVLASKFGPQKSKEDYTNIAESLVSAYMEQNKKLMDEKKMVESTSPYKSKSTNGSDAKKKRG